jgi:membrane protease YdiL (CAAX protease family)
MSIPSSAVPPQDAWGKRILRLPPVRIVIALLAIALPFAAVAIPLNRWVADRSLKKLGALLLTAVIIGAYFAYVRWVERRRVDEFARRGALSELGAGLLLGALLFSLTVGILAALGVYEITGSNGWLAMVATIPGFVLGAVLEELVMRGIVFRILEQSLGSWIALGISAAIFGLLHLLNPGASLLNAGAIMLEAGVLLAAAFMLTRRLWLCIGIHFAWNFCQGGIFSAAVSGGNITGLLQARMTGPVWLTGGRFGAEASVVAVLVCASAGLLLVLAAKRKRSVIRPFWSAEN